MEKQQITVCDADVDIFDYIKECRECVAATQQAIDRVEAYARRMKQEIMYRGSLPPKTRRFGSGKQD